MAEPFFSQASGGARQSRASGGLHLQDCIAKDYMGRTASLQTTSAWLHVQSTSSAGQRLIRQGCISHRHTFMWVVNPRVDVQLAWKSVVT